MIIVDGADRLPLRVDFATLASVPDLAAPLPSGRQGLEHVPIELGAVTSRLELAGKLAKDLFLRVAGNVHEGPVYVHDAAIEVCDQHAFQGTFEHRGGHAQALAVLLLQLLAVANQAVQTRAAEKHQTRAKQHPERDAEQRPVRERGVLIEKTVQ
ncbi:hypothetical protein D9M73_208840 [compost metagenome]